MVSGPDDSVVPSCFGLGKLQKAQDKELVYQKGESTFCLLTVFPNSSENSYIIHFVPHLGTESSYLCVGFSTSAKEHG